ncbi:MAG: right-handed parallel beta-helix repeat-containing protein, partial [Bacteroidota bacterium]
ANWTEDSPNIWHKTISLAPPRLYIDGAEVLRSRDSTNLGAADNTGAIGEWFAQAGATDIYLFANQNPALIYSSIEAADQPQTIIVDFSNYLVFENLDIRGATLGALMLFGSQGTIIRNCKIGAGSRTGLIVRNGSQDITIEDNTFDSEFTLFYGNGSERGCSDGVILINGANDCIVRNNTVRNWAHNGIELLNQTSTSGSVNNNEIAYNFITAPDIPYAHPFGADGSEGNCQNNRFHHNTVVDCRTVIQVNGNDNRVDHNIITGMLNSPSQNRGTAFGIAIGVYGSNLVCHDNVYDHNLIADTDEAGFQIRSFGFSELAYNNQIRNNIFLRTGLSPYPGDYPEDLGLIIYDETGKGAGLGPNTFQNNLFFNENSDSSVIFIEHNNVQLTPTAFNATNGQEGNMVGDNLYGEPIFQTYGDQPKV